MPRKLIYRHALREAMDEELARDPNVVIMGEEVAQGKMGGQAHH
jgi:pyruvate dehydrogenase E1 component beta subunit